MSRAIGRVVAPIAALGIVVALVSLLASSDLLPRSSRPADAAPLTTTATTIIEFQLPAGGAETTVTSEGADATGEGAGGAGEAGTEGIDAEATGDSGAEATAGGTTTTHDAGAGEQTYTVQPGDSPYAIAQRFGVSTTALMRLNGITDPTDLRVGTVLRIPSE